MEKHQLPLNNWPGIFFDFEGIDCCGKTTQVIRAKNWLMAFQNKAVVTTKEPTGSYVGKKIREILKDKDLFKATDPFSLQRLFARDSRIHVQKFIVPELILDRIVCSDRFRASLVFGADKGNEIDIELLMEMNLRYLGNHFIWPDAVFIFDINPSLAIERGKAGGRVFDEMEKLETLEAVRENYLLFSKMYPNCHIIDAARTVEEIFIDVRTIMAKVIADNGNQ